MIKCQACGSNARESVEPYYVERFFGVHIGLINSIKKINCGSCGEETVTIPDVEGLIAAAAVYRCTVPIRLNGAEIKFLRKSIEMSAKELAKILDSRPETVSRWETDKEPIKASNEKLLRLLVGNLLKGGEHDAAPAIDFDEQEIINMNIIPVRAVQDNPIMSFERTMMKVEKKKQMTWDESEQKKAA